MNALARLAVLGTFPFVVSVSACSSQQEGERCDQPADCETGLVCQSFPGQTLSICCPATGLSAVASCNPGTPPPEAGTNEANDASDATSEEAASPDAGADASIEVDASEDGGAE
jgi:hypothetical protein